jgi:hypothetical protein
MGCMRCFARARASRALGKAPQNEQIYSADSLCSSFEITEVRTTMFIHQAHQMATRILKEMEAACVEERC